MCAASDREQSKKDMGRGKLMGAATLQQRDAELPRAAEQDGISPWCNSWGKRLFDLVFATILIAPALPLMAMIALMVTLTSPGRVLFCQRRMGKGGVEFEFAKFRTMAHNGRNGPGVTTKRDSRVTGVGRFLRQSKLDELPQLFHVLSGKMSLVGPRPDLPKYFSAVDQNQLRILGLRPGLTGRASICFRNEEEVLSQAPKGELEAFYAARVLPLKIQLDLEYAQTASLWSDVGMLFRTFLRLF